jgi:hypothetical protein
MPGTLVETRIESMKTNMKISSVALLLAGVTGASVAYANDPITGGFQKSSQDVPVAISGTIKTSSTPGCGVRTGGGLSFNMGNDEGSTEWTQIDGGRWTLARVSGGSIEILCDAGTSTEITFKTNNDFSEDTYASGAQYSSWPVIIVPNFPEQTSGDENNLDESQINGYLAGVTCSTGTCSSVGSNLSIASISSDNSDPNAGLQTITADIEGQLYSEERAYGNVQHSPRDGAASIYVIYDGDGDSASHLPLNYSSFPPA